MSVSLYEEKCPNLTLRNRRQLDFIQLQIMYPASFCLENDLVCYSADPYFAICNENLETSAVNGYEVTLFTRNYRNT